jgi:hypothetical protein
MIVHLLVAVPRRTVVVAISIVFLFLCHNVVPKLVLPRHLAFFFILLATVTVLLLESVLIIVFR